MPPAGYIPRIDSTLFSDFSSRSPNGDYQVNFYDCFQVNPPQSTTIGLLFRVEITERVSLGESGIDFDNPEQEWLFPTLYEDEFQSALKGLYAYVRLTEEERRASDWYRYKYQFWQWSADSRLFTIFLTDFATGRDYVVRFDLALKTCMSVKLDHFPTPSDFRRVAGEAFPDPGPLPPPTPRVYNLRPASPPAETEPLKAPVPPDWRPAASSQLKVLPRKPQITPIRPKDKE